MLLCSLFHLHLVGIQYLVLDLYFPVKCYHGFRFPNEVIQVPTGELKSSEINIGF